MPCMKRVYLEKVRRATDRQQGTKSAPRPYDKPLTNNLSFFPAFVFNWTRLVRVPGEWFRKRLLDALGQKGGRLSSGPTVLRGPAPPLSPAYRPDPPVVLEGFGLDKLILKCSLNGDDIQTCLACKKFTKTNRVQSTVQEPRGGSVLSS